MTHIIYAGKHIALVTCCDDGPNTVYESSCVFPHNDEKFWSALILDSDGFRHEMAFAGQSKKTNLLLIKMVLVLMCFLWFSRVSHACKLTDKTYKAPGFNYLIYRDINSSLIKQVHWRYKPPLSSLICQLQQQFTTKSSVISHLSRVE